MDDSLIIVIRCDSPPIDHLYQCLGAWTWAGKWGILIHSVKLNYVAVIKEVEVMDLYKWVTGVGVVDWQRAQKMFPFLEALGETPQNPVYHGEGDVLTHTKMVVTALIESREWGAFSEKEQKILFLTCLFHDIGKASCTKVEDGRIVSPRHAVKGARLSRIFLWKKMPESVSFQMREEIVSLIAIHSLPLWFYKRDNPERSVVKASSMVSLKLLAALSEADIKGRICSDTDELLGRIELFRETAQMLKCYDAPYPFQSDVARFDYFRKPDMSLEYQPYEDFKSSVTLMAGLPGAGKDYWIKENMPDIPVISLDDIRKRLNITPEKKQHEVVQTAKETARVYLREGTSFVWNATNVTKALREQLIDLFCAYGARVEIVYVEPFYDVLIRQNQEREKAVALSVVEKMIRRLEVPRVYEGHGVRWVVG